MPELQLPNFGAILEQGQQNALRQMQMQQLMQDTERKNQLEALMRTVDWSQPQEAFKKIGQYLAPDQALAFAQAISKQNKEQQVMDMVSRGFGQPHVAAMNAEGRGPTQTAANAGIGGINPMLPIQLSMLGESGKAAADMISKMMTPHNVPEGSMSVDQFGRRTERPRMEPGMTVTGYGPDGRATGVGILPGFLSGLGQIESTKEGAKAGYQFENVPVPGMPGATEPVSRARLAQEQGTPGVQVPPGVQQSRDATRLAILEEELRAKPNDPDLQAEVARARQGAVGRRTQTPAERISQEKTAEFESKRDFSMSGIGAILDRAENLLRGRSGTTVAGVPVNDKQPLPTGSGIGTVADSAAKLFGITLPGAAKASSLKAVGNSLVLKMPRMEGPQSDADRLLYQEMAGKLGDSTETIEARLDALGTIRQLWGKYEKVPAGNAPEARRNVTVNY